MTPEDGTSFVKVTAKESISALQGGLGPFGKACCSGFFVFVLVLGRPFWKMLMMMNS